MRIVDLYCDRCARVRTFEQPPCADGHGSECEEWACTGCGAAVLVAPFLVRRGRRRPAPVRRQAA